MQNASEQIKTLQQAAALSRVYLNDMIAKIDQLQKQLDIDEFLVGMYDQDE